MGEEGYCSWSATPKGEVKAAAAALLTDRRPATEDEETEDEEKRGRRDTVAGPLRQKPPLPRQPTERSTRPTGPLD